jgi:hypothetical protein
MRIILESNQSEDLGDRKVLWHMRSKQELWSQQPAFTRQRPVNNNRGMVFSAQFVPMVEHAAMEYVMPSLSNNCTTTEEWCFLGDACRVVFSRTSQSSQEYPPRGGEFEYLHRSPASRRRRRNRNPVPGGITVPPASGVYKYGNLDLQVGESRI